MAKKFKTTSLAALLPAVAAPVATPPTPPAAPTPAQVELQKLKAAFNAALDKLWPADRAIADIHFITGCPFRVSPDPRCSEECQKRREEYFAAGKALNDAQFRIARLGWQPTAEDQMWMHAFGFEE